MTGKLFLIPSNIGETSIDSVIPLNTKKVISSIKYFIVENLRSGRRYLKKVDKSLVIEDLTFFELNKRVDSNSIPDFLSPLLQGNDVGLISEAGLPCVADPGNAVVELAHNYNINVVPLVGPSSIFLALMASGFNGQNFSFNGYLPINKKERKNSIKLFEDNSAKNNQTQIFIETPYRNNNLLKDLLLNCKNSTFLCIASEITTESEYIKTMRIDEWKKTKIDLHKKPAIFLIYVK